MSINYDKKILYKYRCWSNKYHKNILLKNQLYLASPADFNDPFDCRINMNFSLLSPKEEEKYKNELAISGFSEAVKRGLDYGEVLTDFERRFSDKEKFQREADSVYFKYQDESYAIFSCSSECDNITMWSHYADHHKGFCVGFWTDEMIKSNKFGKIGEVVYEDDYPQIKPSVAKKDEKLIHNSFIETHTKAKVWEYESEFRFMSNYFPRKLKPEDRIVPIPDHWFAEVILGINITPKDRYEIMQICKKKNIPVFQAEKVNYKFKINKVLQE